MVRSHGPIAEQSCGTATQTGRPEELVEQAEADGQRYAATMNDEMRG
jgi:hypothetical protein